MVRWRAEHAEQCRPVAALEAIMDRLVGGHRSARQVFAALGAAAQSAA
jgi:hypothetical protein